MSADEYEYGVRWTHISSGEQVGQIFWEDLGSAQEALDHYNADTSRVINNGGDSFYTAKAVRRLKAGPIEPVPLPGYDDLLTRLDEAHAEEQKFNLESYGARDYDPDEATLYRDAAEAIRELNQQS